jgi:hypothetical protein
MSEKIDLKKIERKAWMTYFDDGLLDILFGIILLDMGIAPLLETAGVPYILPYGLIFIAGYAIVYFGKRYITMPRMGFVKFGRERRSRSAKARTALLVSVAFGIVVALLVGTGIIPSQSQYFGAIAFGVNAIVVFSVMGYFLDFNRVYIYGVFFAASIVLMELSRAHVGTTYDNVIGFGVFGMITTLTGMVYLIRFIQRYPVRSGSS